MPELEDDASLPHADDAAEPSVADITSGQEHHGERPSMLVRAAHIFALSGFAVAQPLFGLLGLEPDFWIARQATVIEAILFILFVVVAVPALLFLVEWLVDLVSHTASWVVHVVLVAGLSAAVATVVIDNVTSGDWAPKPILALAVVAGAGFAVAYVIVRFVRDLLTILVIAPVIFALLLLIRLPPLGGYDVPLIDAGVTGDNPVVVVVFDEFQMAGVQNRDGSIDRTRFPGLAEFADQATWYRYATTVHDDTLSAVPAILTGNYPERGRLAISSDHPVNLFTILGSTHTIVANEDITRLCPPSLCGADTDESTVSRFSSLISDSAVVYLHTAVPKRLAYRLPEIGGRWGNFLAADAAVVTDAAPGSETDRLARLTGGEARAVAYGEFLDSFDPADGAALYYLHVDLPHIPWVFTPSGMRYPEIGIAGKDSRGDWRGDPWLVQQGYVRTALHTGFVDQLVSDTAERLKTLGMWDDALVVFVADHGQHFAVEEPRRALRDYNLPGIGAVPLLIKYPGQQSGVLDEENAQTIDILPTMVEALGGSLSGVDGVPLQGSNRPSDKLLLSEGGPTYPVPLESYAQMDQQYRDDMLDLAPAGIGFAGMFEAVGPRPDLFGESVEEQPMRTVSGTAELIDGDLFADYDPDGTEDPVGVLYRVVSDTLTDFYAVAVNGTILATIPAYGEDDSSASILAIVPPGSFIEGANSVEILGIEGEPGSTTLIRFG